MRTAPPAGGGCATRRLRRREPNGARAAAAAAYIEAMPTAPEAFDAHAADYDALRRRLVPVFDAFYATALEALSLAPAPLRRILDVGAGTGLLSEMVRRALPDAELTLLDGSQAMLETAQARLGAGATYVRRDVAEELPAGPWDAIVSALAIHHLPDAGKRELYARIHAMLAPGAVFVNAEHVAGPTPRLDRVYADWHRMRSAELGTTAEEWAAGEQRMSFDHLASLEAQLAWLREAGFTEVDCLYKRYGFTVIVAQRAD